MEMRTNSVALCRQTPFIPNYVSNKFKILKPLGLLINCNFIVPGTQKISCIRNFFNLLDLKEFALTVSFHI